MYFEGLGYKPGTHKSILTITLLDRGRLQLFTKSSNPNKSNGLTVFANWPIEPFLVVGGLVGYFNPAAQPSPPTVTLANEPRCALCWLLETVVKLEVLTFSALAGGDGRRVDKLKSDHFICVDLHRVRLTSRRRHEIQHGPAWFEVRLVKRRQITGSCWETVT